MDLVCASEIKEPGAADLRPDPIYDFPRNVAVMVLRLTIYAANLHLHLHRKRYLLSADTVKA